MFFPIGDIHKDIGRSAVEIVHPGPVLENTYGNDGEFTPPVTVFRHFS
jgi:hypothetical protein